MTERQVCPPVARDKLSSVAGAGPSWAESGLNQRHTWEEVTNFVGSRFRGIGPMHGVAFNACCVKLANRARSGVGGIRGAHHFAQAQDGVLAFQNHYQRAAGAHEIRQASKETFGPVNGVKAFGFLLAELHQSGRHNLKLMGLEDLDDVADVSRRDGVGFNDGLRAFNSHGYPIRANSEL